MRGGRVPRDRDGVFGNVQNGRHGRRRGKHGWIRSAVQTRSRRLFHAQRGRPRRFAALRRRGARVQAGVGHFQFYGRNRKQPLKQRVAR